MAKHRSINTFKPSKKAQPTVDSRPIELRINSLSDDGRGVARHNNKVVFIADALMGEQVVAKISRSHKRYDEARLIEVTEPSDDRVEPPCAIYERCGGCQLQHLSYAGQLMYKQSRFAKLIAATAPSRLIPSIIHGENTGYRHRARLAYSGGHLGFKAKASHDIVPVDTCPLLEDSLNTVLAQSRGPIEGFFGDNAKGEVILTADFRGRIGIRILKEGFVDLKRSEKLADDIKAPAFLHSVVGSKGQSWLGAHEPLYFQATDTRTLRYQPGDFTQVNTSINRQIVKQSLSWLAPQAGERITDYFCGLGNFSVALADAGAQVIGFDSGKGMIESANQQAKEGKLAIEYFCADLFNDAEIIVPASCHKVILDPPRAGAKKLCERIAKQKVITTVVYVSCDPATLARDLAILSQASFKITDAAMADMFPHTHHIESVVLLQR
jgi:23S rRNA (uracil1939-C5)-methyltransferase